MDKSILIELARQAERESPYPNAQFPPSLYYRFLKVLAAYLQPKLSVELGVCGGGGSLHLALGWSSGIVVGVDIANDHPDHIKIIQAVCPNFHFRLGDSIYVAPEIYNRYGEVDILFIDTIHEKERTLEEFEAYKLYLSDTAIVCFDDLFRPGMEEAWNLLPGNKLRLDKLHDGAENGGGFGAIYNL